MKKSVGMLIGLMLSAQLVWAQEDRQTLFDNDLSLSNLGFMVEPGFQFTTIAGESAGFFQIRTGIVFNDRITVGGFYGDMVNDIRPSTLNSSLPPRAHLDAYTAGGFLEYTVYSSKLVHLTLPLSAGMMEVEIDDEGRYYDYEERKNLFFEPRAMIELNLHRFARLNAGLGYRIMGSAIQDDPGVPEAGNALTFQVGLKMGVFSFSQLKQ
nr:hypothetical protein [Cytophagales bacterium]